MEAKQIMSVPIEDIIFERRNKQYGAYDIRRRYNRNVAIATAIAISALLLALFTPQIIDRLTPEEEMPVVADRVVTITELDAPPPLDETKPPPPPLEVPPPPKTIQFVPPKVTEEDVIEEPPPTIKEIRETPTSSTTTEGDDVEYAPPKVDVIEVEPPKDVIHDFAEEQPQFKGNLAKYFNDHIKYPQMAIENNIQGVVYVEAIITPEGTVEQVSLAKGLPGGGAGINEEAMRVVKNMPKGMWEPAKINGRPVKIRIKIPVKFVLQ